MARLPLDTIDRFWKKLDSLRLGPRVCFIDAGPSQQTQNSEIEIKDRQQALAEEQAAGSRELRGTTLPGLKVAENYYQGLATGDPDHIHRAIAPAVEQIARGGEVAKERLENEAPRGGEKRLASEMIDANTAGQSGRLATQAYTSSFPALASLANTGIGLSLSQMAQSFAGLGGASNTAANIGQQEAAGKASSMGFLGSLMGAGGQAAAAFAA